MCVSDAEGICFNCLGAVAEEKQKGGGTLILQDQLPPNHPGRQLTAGEERTVWFIKRQRDDEPSRWSGDSAGVICHEDQVLEVYHVDIENKVEEADHVKTNDETFKPENLKKDDKN